MASRNIVDQLQAAGISWRAYLEGMPSGCFQGARSGAYAKKHNPFLYYDDNTRSASRCSHLVGFGQLASDLRRGRLPTYAWISPNLCDDGHDCGLAGGDRFLSRTVPLLIRELGPHGFLLLTWDEGTTALGCCGGSAAGGHIVTIVAGPTVRHGARQSTPVDHYGVLGTVEASARAAAAGGRSERRERAAELAVQLPAADSLSRRGRRAAGASQPDDRVQAPNVSRRSCAFTDA